MDQFTARCSPDSGWSSPLPSWDGPGTVVLVFGNANLLDDDAPLHAVTDGELSPMSAGTCDLHNQTMTVTGFRERAA